LVEAPFTTSFQEPSAAALASDADERVVLEKIVADYNTSAGPGYFQLEQLSARHFSVVGRGSKTSSGHPIQKPAILDTLVTIPAEERTLGETLQLICQQVTKTTGTKLELFPSAGNILNASVTIGGSDVAARQLIAQAFAATRARISVDTLYSIFLDSYALNYQPTMRGVIDERGNKRLEELPALPPPAQP
jgi:hypothetical protein